MSDLLSALADEFQRCDKRLMVRANRLPKWFDVTLHSSRVGFSICGNDIELLMHRFMLAPADRWLGCGISGILLSDPNSDPINEAMGWLEPTSVSERSSIRRLRMLP